MTFDPIPLREDFPLLARGAAGAPLVYFDNAATSLKPRVVIDAVAGYLAGYSGNIHRAQHALSERASLAYEDSRRQVARFIGARSGEVVFVRGATEGANLVADGLRLAPDDNVVTTLLEHHSNLLPWRTRCEVRAAPLGPDGLPDLAAAEALVDARTRLIAVTSCSNVTGVFVPVATWAAMAHRRGVPLFVDAAQAAAHERIDVVALDCDFLVLSGHKLCGPPGAGVLYGKREALAALRPLSLGGGTVAHVGADLSYTLRDVPWRLEAGTPDIAAVIGLGAAVGYLDALGLEDLAEHEATLGAALDATIVGLPGLVAHAPAGVRRAPIVAMSPAGGMGADWLARALNDTCRIMTRAGHHCAHPLHEALGLPATLRASLAWYNTVDEVERFGAALRTLLAQGAS